MDFYTLDEQERVIIKELMKNPRATDNAIGKCTGVPVMTVNRKRKKLEEKGILRYFATIDRRRLGVFEAHQLYIIKLRAGITKQQYMQSVEQDAKIRMSNTKYIGTTYVGERDGHLAIIFLLDGFSQDELVNEFNGRIVPYFHECFGKDAIVSIETVPITERIRVHHNYLPSINMENGIVKQTWPDEYMFVDR
ncbi:MAG: winged helix-turn-helix transcriptional regulator [Candidatus Woesearchaeota archaeon]